MAASSPDNLSYIVDFCRASHCHHLVILDLEKKLSDGEVKNIDAFTSPEDSQTFRVEYIDTQKNYEIMINDFLINIMYSDIRRAESAELACSLGSLNEYALQYHPCYRFSDGRIKGAEVKLSTFPFSSETSLHSSARHAGLELWLLCLTLIKTIETLENKGTPSVQLYIRISDAVMYDSHFQSAFDKIVINNGEINREMKNITFILECDIVPERKEVMRKNILHILRTGSAVILSDVGVCSDKFQLFRIAPFSGFVLSSALVNTCHLASSQSIIEGMNKLSATHNLTLLAPAVGTPEQAETLKKMLPDEIWCDCLSTGLSQSAFNQATEIL